MSKETKWTPGPWVVNEKFSSPHLLDADYCAITAGSGIYDAGRYQHDGFEFTGYIGMANANLIAAAPELYDALDDLLAEYMSVLRGPYCQYDEDCEITDKVKSAMEKARGESLSTN